MEVNRVQVVTDAEGVALLKGQTRSEFRLVVDKPGYYSIRSGSRFLSNPADVAANANGEVEVALKLRPIVRQVPMLGRAYLMAKLPSPNKPYGFDLVESDWVAPHGVGKVADLMFEVADSNPRSSDGILQLTATAVGKDNGLQAVPGEFLPLEGSLYQMPYQAPETGYENSIQWQRSKTGNPLGESPNQGKVVLLRIRSQHGEHGKLDRALYGSMEFAVGVRLDPQTGYSINIGYWLNPEWERNLERDPEHEAKALKQVVSAGK
jgi:hypothetical protein